MSSTPSASYISHGSPASSGQLVEILAPRRAKRLSSSASRSRSRNGIHPPLDIGVAPVIVICHLHWDWVWQRPQQFASRLAHRHPMLFVETLFADVSTADVQLRSPANHPCVTVAQVRLPLSCAHDPALQDATRRTALQHCLKRDLNGAFSGAILWFYDPMAVIAFAGHLGERAIVYDCMDELSQFKGAPPGLIERERLLLRQADVVFCGGRKMREKRLPLNPNCHFFGTGVDCDHFGQARSDELTVDPDIAALSAPVLGYFGVVDERIDYELLAMLADARSDWSIVMVGPHAKVDPADFPQRPNLHFIGGRPYQRLPAITKGFSVCLMPFALNEATEFINPTKALEYMAAGRSVVSTALAEVKSNFSGVARVGASRREFVDLCLQECEQPDAARIERGLTLARSNTWESIVAQMERHISTAAQKRAASTTVTPLAFQPLDSAAAV